MDYISKLFKTVFFRYFINKIKASILSLTSLTLFLAVIIFINGSPFYFGDAYGYFHTAKTLAVQNTLITSTIPEYTPYAAHGVVIRDDGMAVSVYPSGVSILWYPFLKVASFFDQGTMYNDYFKAFNGHSLADGLAVLAASGFYTFLAIILLKKLLMDKGFSKKIAHLSIIGAYISTYALSYFTQQPGYSHTYEIFAFSLFLVYLERFRAKQNKTNALVIGLSASLLISIRPVDALLFIPIAFVLFKYWRYLPWFILGVIPFFVYTMSYNFVSYGNVFSSGYYVFGGQTFNFDQFRLWEILFSDFRGIFFLSPAIIIAFITIWKNYKDKWMMFVYGLPPLFIIVAISFWPYWWAGDSIGQRFFIVFVPIIALGLAHLFNNDLRSGKKLWTWGVFILIAYSLFVALLYRFSPTDRLVEKGSAKANYYATQKVPVENMASPFDLINYQVSLVKKSNSLGEYFNNLSSGFNQGRSLSLLLFGATDPIVIIEEPKDKSFYLYIVPDTSRAKKEGDLRIYFKGKNEYIVLLNIDFSKNSRVLIDCTIGSCLSDVGYKILQLDQNETPSKYIKVSNDFEVCVDATIKVNFVNKKLPAY